MSRWSHRESVADAAYPHRWLAAFVLSFVFGPYFAKHVAPDSVAGTVLWGPPSAFLRRR